MGGGSIGIGVGIGFAGDLSDGCILLHCTISFIQNQRDWFLKILYLIEKMFL
jgi:hypothetical protein